MRYFEPGSIHTLHLEAKNTTAKDWTYRFVILSGGNEIDEIVSDIAAGVAKLLSAEVQMPEVSQPTEVIFQVHAYETSKGYDLGIVAEETVIVQSAAPENEYNASAYFDDDPQSSYIFEAGTEHKVTVVFTNPYDVPLEFYVHNDIFNVFNAWGFFTVGAGQTVIKEVDLLMSTTPQLVGPVTFKIHCTTPGIGKVDVPAGSLEIIESTVEQAGTIQVVPVTASVPQGAPFEYDVKITNTTNKVWSYNFTVHLYDKNGEMIGGMTSVLGVGPYSTGVFEYATSMIKDWGVPPAGTATIKTVFLGRTETQGTFTITAATIPAAQVAYVSHTWFRIPEENNTLMMRVNLKNNSGRTLSSWKGDLWSTHRADGSVYESGLSPDGWDGDWPAGTTKPFLANWWNMGFNPGVYDVILGLKTYEPGTWILNGMSYPVSLGSYTVI